MIGQLKEWRSDIFSGVFFKNLITKVFWHITFIRDTFLNFFELIFFFISNNHIGTATCEKYMYDNHPCHGWYGCCPLPPPPLDWIPSLGDYLQ